MAPNSPRTCILVTLLLLLRCKEMACTGDVEGEKGGSSNLLNYRLVGVADPARKSRFNRLQISKLGMNGGGFRWNFLDLSATGCRATSARNSITRSAVEYFTTPARAFWCSARKRTGGRTNERSERKRKRERERESVSFCRGGEGRSCRNTANVNIAFVGCVRVARSIPTLSISRIPHGCTAASSITSLRSNLYCAPPIQPTQPRTTLGRATIVESTIFLRKSGAPYLA